MNAPTPLDQLLPELDVAQLDALEEEAIFILRETAAAFERPALLFSGGKDSCVVLHLAQKAFKLEGADQARLPFPLLHVDTGHNFPEVIEFRDRVVAELGEQLIVAHLEDSMARGSVRLASPEESRNGHQSVTLMEAVDEHRFDVLIGGARRDEEKARAKERDPVAPRQLRPVAAEEPAPRALDALQHTLEAGRAHALVSDQQLDRARRLALHPA